MDACIYSTTSGRGRHAELSQWGNMCDESNALMFAPASHQQQVLGHTCWEMLSVEESLVSLEGMVEPPTLENLFCIVHKCRKQKSLEYARRVHVHIHDNGLDAHRALGNHLVPLFVECGSLFEADQVFHRLTHRNEFSWTSLIQGYVGCGEFQHALDLFEIMQEECVHPSTHTFLALLKACARMKWVERGREIHAEINEKGFQSDSFVGNTVVDMYAKCGALEEAQEAFHKLLVRDVVSWNALITGYVEHGLDEEALLCLEKLQSEGMSPDSITFVGSLKACGNIGAVDRSYKIHTEIVKGGADSDPIIGNALVDMYARSGSLVEARKILDKLSIRDAISWSALIAGYTEYGFGEEALNCLEWMRQEGVPPDVVTFVCSLKACGIIGAIHSGKKIHAEIIAEGFEGDPYVGNILMDMYANCGWLLEAQEVFDELLPVRDAISWNTLIAGYAEHGLSKEALICFEQMQLEGVSLNAATFVSSLKACSSTGDLKKGQELLSKIIIKGFDKDPFVTNSLVDMFAKCGSFAEARDLFEELQPVEDAVSWNVLISGYAEHGLVDEVLNCLEQMQQGGVTQDAVTFVCSLKACGSIRAIDRIHKMHAEMARCGFDKNVFIGNTLVDVYAKCGSLTEAQTVFNSLSFREVLSWSSLMTGFLEHGLGEDVLNCLEQMEVEGFSPNAVTFLCSLKACASTGAIDKGREIHAEIVKQGNLRDPFVGSSLVDLYSKCGSLQEAQMVFDELPDHDVVSWTALILGLAEYGFGDKALECLDQMLLEGIYPNAATFVCCLKVCGSMRAFDRGKELHAEAAKAGFNKDSLVGNTLVDMYGKCGSLAEAHKVFDELSVQDVIAWTALISGNAEHGLAEEALICLEQMQQEGVSPTSATFLCSLKACASMKATGKGHELHAQMVKVGLEEDASVGIALVDMFSKCGLFEEACEVLNQLSVLDAVSWTALITGYAEHGHCEEALKCLEEMQRDCVSPDVVSWNAVISGFIQQGGSGEALLLYACMQEQGILPNDSTLVSILEACGDMASFENGKRVHARIHGVDGGKSTEVVMSTSLIDMYSKCGSMGDAQQVFDAVHTKDFLKWTALITGYARQGSSELVFCMFERMREEGVQPDEVTFLSILSVCSHVGLVEKGKMHFQAMISAHDIIPTIKHHNCMVDLLGRAGQLSEAASMLEKIPIQPDLVTWSAMLSACHKWGNEELGRQAFEHVARLDENYASAFVLMSNIIVNANEFDYSDHT